MTTDADRIIEIETKLAYLEDSVQQLNSVVCRQQDQIERLEAAEKLLMDRIGELAESSAVDVSDERPPHY